MTYTKEVELAIAEYNDAFEEEFQMPLRDAIDLYEKNILKTDELIASDEFANVWIGVMKNTWKSYDYSYLEFATKVNREINSHSLKIPHLTWKDAKKGLMDFNEEMGNEIPFDEYSFKCSTMDSLIRGFISYELNRFASFSKRKAEFYY